MKSEKRIHSPYPILWKTGFLLLVLSVMFSCKNDLEKIYEFESSTNPDLIIKKPVILRSVSGKVDVKIEAPIVKRFYTDSPKTEFSEGVFLHFFDSDKSIKTTLSSKYAISMENEKRMEARNNVIIIDYKNGDTIYTEQIIWDQNSHRIYSTKDVKKVNGENVIYGEGFEMDEETNVRTIFKPRGVEEWEDN